MKRQITHLLNLFELERKSLLIIFLFFVFSASLSAVTLLFLPDILKASGLTITNLPKADFTALIKDFWGNLPLNGAIVALIYGSTAFSSETDINKRGYFILSRPITNTEHYYLKSVFKLTAFFIVLILASIYTYLFGSIFYAPPDFGTFLLSSIEVSLATTIFLAVVLSTNSILNTGATIGIGVLFIVLDISVSVLAQFIDWIKWFSPTALTLEWVKFMENDYSLYVQSISVEIVWIVFPIVLGTILYRNRDI